MESRHFLNIIGNGNDPGKCSGNFCLAPSWKINWPRCGFFFRIFPMNSLNLFLIPSVKWMATGALGQSVEKKLHLSRFLDCTKIVCLVVINQNV